ncbi:hypothetical protein MJO29_001268 [Puccinia striiformis f. sp. tritici]|uniref:Uncharacterized protein n=2 Tax=Puccinia striiformis TaxID=27350 RepID=A0A0L0VDH0_9BASI|nr:hypothetical protein MJO29_001268 [Puccinia striiformis f. sp. tritici]KNE97340.1 hypothetical protein PSTG_09318 [Puccinia striiformis f. sp. tritici PST-78]
MADNSSLPSDSVLEALEARLEKYDTMGHAGPTKEFLTEDELKTKNALLDKLQYKLLPSIQDQIGPLVASLGLRSNSSQNFELTCSLLSTLDDTWWQTMLCIESAAIDIPLTGTHDHHLRRCKNFRCNQMLHKITEVLSIHLFPLVMGSILFMRASKVSTNYSETTECQVQQTDLLRESATCSVLTRKTIEWLQGSDFSIIQDQWQDKQYSLDPLLTSLTRLTHPALTGRRKNMSALRKHVVKLAKLAIPLIKLARTFSNKLSKTTTTKLPFTLNTELNSETLTTLHEHTESIERCFYRLVRALVGSFEANVLVNGQTSLGNPVHCISQILESTLVILALHLIPLPTTNINHQSPGNDYKAWFTAWHVSWHRAINNFLTTLHFEGQQAQQPLAPA